MINEQHFILIDDSTLDLFINEKMLLVNKLAASVQKFLNPAEALAQLANMPNDSYIILLDLQMPIMNGFAFIEAFNNFEQTLKDKFKIFMLSSTVDAGDIQQAKSMDGILDILSKPLDTKLLVRLMEKHC